MFGLSCAAQRGCWKLFHDTPTVHAEAAEPLGAAADAAVVGAALAPPPEVAAGLPPLLLVQAAATIATVPTISPSRRYILSLLLLERLLPSRTNAGVRLGYHPSARQSDNRSVAWVRVDWLIPW